MVVKGPRLDSVKVSVNVAEVVSQVVSLTVVTTALDISARRGEG